MSERVTARISDREVLEALDKAIDRHGNKSEAVRYALRETFVDGSDTEDAEIDVPKKAIHGYQVMRDHCDSSDMLIEVNTAKSLVASETNTPLDGIKSTVFEPLRKEGLLDVTQRVSSAFLVVRAIDEKNSTQAHTGR